MNWNDMETANRRYQTHHQALESAVPSRHLVVLTCMDARIDPRQVLGLDLGEAHILRNAGARVTEDVIRSLAISEQALSTEAVLVMPHTRCGVLGLDPEAIRAKLGDDLPPLDLRPMQDLRTSLLQDLAMLRESPWIAQHIALMGAIFDIDSGAMTWVAREA